MIYYIDNTNPVLHKSNVNYYSSQNIFIMNIESILGIVGSIITIAAFIGFKCDLVQLFKKRPINELYEELLDKKLTDKERRIILKRINNYPEINKRITDEYIERFTLGKLGRETLFLDICNKNDIEPTPALVKDVVGYNMSSITASNMKQHTKEELHKDTLVTSVEKETNDNTLKGFTEQTVYMSELLMTKYPDACNRLIGILEKHSVKYAFLKGTKDIWCRDYMPVQTESGKFIQFKYNPSYLKGNKDWEESRSDVEEVCRVNNIHAQSSDINLDGGNVLICEGRAILSDRIFSENPDKTRNELIDELGKLLECEIIIIKALNSACEDFTGHADGMVRFVNKSTILGNRLSDDYKYIQDDRRKIIEKYNLKYIDVPFFSTKDSKHRDSAIGIYVNYLKVNNLIVVPVFGREEDQEAVDIIQKAFPDKVIETINYNEVAIEGGLLNCTTWVVR